jgi:hypothetical protein
MPLPLHKCYPEFLRSKQAYLVVFQFFSISSKNQKNSLSMSEYYRQFFFIRSLSILSQASWFWLWPELEAQERGDSPGLLCLNEILHSLIEHCAYQCGRVPLRPSDSDLGQNWKPRTRGIHCSWVPLRPSDSDFSQNWKRRTREIPQAYNVWKIFFIHSSHCGWVPLRLMHRDSEFARIWSPGLGKSPSKVWVLEDSNPQSSGHESNTLTILPPKTTRRPTMCLPTDTFYSSWKPKQNRSQSQKNIFPYLCLFFFCSMYFFAFYWWLIAVCR